MPHAQKSESVASLRQQLTEADHKRRALLVALFLQHPGDTRQIIETLFHEADRLTLDKVELLLSLDTPDASAQS